MSKELLQNRIYYKIQGQGPPLVFIHGLLGFWRNFYRAAGVLSEDYSCLLYDQRGHGRSFHRKPYTIQRLAEDLKLLCESLGWNQISIVGHSLGGYTALRFAYDYPSFVKKMIIVDASPQPREDMGRKAADLISSLPDSFSSRGEAMNFFKKSIEKGLMSKTMAGFLAASLDKPQSGALKFLFDREGALQLLQNVRKENFLSMAGALKAPVLFLRGGESKHFLKSNFERLLRENPHLEGREAEGCGHWIHAEQPELFIKILKEFLSR